MEPIFPIRRACANMVAMIAAALLLAACGAATVSSIPAANNAGFGQPVVFGKFVVIENGKPLTWSSDTASGTGDGNFHVLILRKGQNVAVTHQLRGDGSFAWSLAPGDYALAGYYWRRSGSRRSDRIWMDFSVPFKAEGIYLGSIKLDRGGASTAAVTDEMDRSKATLTSLAPSFKGKIDKKLMAKEKLSTREKSRRAICDKSWGVPCEDDYNGVVALAPNTSKRTTPTISTLQPTFKWEGATGSNVRYDIVVYESMGYFGSRELPGGVIEYAEGLQKPEHRLAKPLKTNTKYYWSVRLRRGDMVSNWTRYSYVDFYGLRVSRRLNQLYSFDTGG